MNDTTFGTQTSVYFRKIFRIAIREKAWKYLIFATIIASIVVFIVGDGMFSDFGYDSTKSGFFTLASACIWIGIFNSIQSICKEHEIIRAEYRQGMKMSSYIAAHVIWQALLCLAESILVFILCCIKMNFNKSPSLIISAYSENFVTIYLLTFGAAVLGLMISSISGNPTTAMTIMPFVLIVQLILAARSLTSSLSERLLLEFHPQQMGNGGVQLRVRPEQYGAGDKRQADGGKTFEQHSAEDRPTSAKLVLCTRRAGSLLVAVLHSSYRFQRRNKRCGTQAPKQKIRKRLVVMEKSLKSKSVPGERCFIVRTHRIGPRKQREDNSQ